MKKLKLTESQFQRIVKESLSRSYEINKIINRLYKMTNKITGHLVQDDAWQNVSAVVNQLKMVDGVIDLYVSAGQYHNYLNTSKDNTLPYRTYKLTAETEFGNIGGELTCSAAGNVEDPFSSYDITCTFWKEND